MSVILELIDRSTSILVSKTKVVLGLTYCDKIWCFLQKIESFNTKMNTKLLDFRNKGNRHKSIRNHTCSVFLC